MTGYGDARGHAGALGFVFEVRSVNNRHFKLTVRAPEPYSSLETEIEKVVRKSVHRGTVTVHLRVDRQTRAEDVRINAVALVSYVSQIRNALEGMPTAHIEAVLAGAMALPGICPEGLTDSAELAGEWPLLEQGLTAALFKFQQMRADEGRRMAEELASLRGQIVEQLGEIKKLEPGVVAAFRDRLRDRVKQLLADTAVAVNDHDLLREIAVYAERSDVAEEVVRLESHLAQFAEVLTGRDASPGRKLEFIVQEMGREANTLGSKAGDVAISRRVVEIKTVLEKIREIIANIE